MAEKRLFSEPEPFEPEWLKEQRQGLARRTDPATSHEAAKRISITPLELACLNALEAFSDGLTSEEIAERTGHRLVTISPRLRPLAEKGLIYDSGLRRRNSSGAKAIVWKISHR